MKEGQPKAIYLKDYKVPPYLIDETNLHVDIHEDFTTIITVLRIRRNPECSDKEVRNLNLDGSKVLDTQQITIDGRDLSANEYRADEDN